MLEAFIDAPQRFRQLCVFPILAREGPVLPYLHTQEALESGALTVQEKAEGQAPVLLVRNRSLYCVLILDGERLAGDDTDRMAVRPILLAGKSVTQIPSTPPVERRENDEKDDPDLEEWIKAFPVLGRQVGMLAFLGRKVLGLEALGASNLYAPVHESFLVRIVRESVAAGVASERDPLAAERDAAQLLESLEEADRVRTEGIGLGEYWILKGPVQGGELIHEGRFVHLSVTPAEDDPPFDPSMAEAD